MYKRKWVLFIATFSVLPFLFQNCGEGFISTGQSSSFSFCKSQASSQSPFASQKVFLPKSYFTSAQQKLSTTSVKLNMTVDVSCLEQAPKDITFLGRKIELKGALKRQAKAVVPVSVPPSTPLTEIENEFETNPCLLGMTEEHIVRKNQSTGTMPLNDPQASSQRHLTIVEHIDSLQLQAEITQDVVIAFIDSGVDYNHPDLSTRMWQAADGSYGYNYIGLNTDPLDDDGHGTHVAGITAAVENNRVGVAGLTSDYVKVMAIKALNQRGAGSSTDVANGIYFAIRNGADIINLSIESPGRNIDLENAIQDAVTAGIVVTTATGNQSEEIRTNNLYAPAYMGPSIGGVISVASIDTQGLGLSSFSNYSNNFAEIAAPGAENSLNSNGGILSTQLGGGWARIRGTSQATPIVTAAAAILIGYLKTQNIAYTPSGIEGFIKSDGVMINPGLKPYVNEGKIINLGFLSSNLKDYLNSGSLNDNSFNGGETTGQTCIIN